MKSINSVQLWWCMVRGGGWCKYYRMLCNTIWFHDALHIILEFSLISRVIQIKRFSQKISNKFLQYLAKNFSVCPYRVILELKYFVFSPNKNNNSEQLTTIKQPETPHYWVSCQISKFQLCIGNLPRLPKILIKGVIIK